MDSIVIKLHNKSKLNAKTAIEKVYKETMGNMSKDVTKDVLLNKMVTLKIVFKKR